jgi:hypothetical protein
LKYKNKFSTKNYLYKSLSKKQKVFLLTFFIKQYKNTNKQKKNIIIKNFYKNLKYNNKNNNF